MNAWLKSGAKVAPPPPKTTASGKVTKPTSAIEQMLQEKFENGRKRPLPQPLVPAEVVPPPLHRSVANVASGAGLHSQRGAMAVRGLQNTKSSALQALHTKHTAARVREAAVTLDSDVENVVPLPIPGAGVDDGKCDGDVVLAAATAAATTATAVAAATAATAHDFAAQEGPDVEGIDEDDDNDVDTTGTTAVVPAARHESMSLASFADSLVVHRQQQTLDQFVMAGAKKRAPMFASSTGVPAAQSAHTLGGALQCLHVRTFVADEMREAVGAVRDASILQMQPAACVAARGGSAAARCAADMALGQLVARRLQVVDRVVLQKVRTRQGTRVGVSCLGFDRAGGRLAVGGSNGLLRVYDFAACVAAIPQAQARPRLQPPSFLLHTERDVADLSWSAVRPSQVAVAFTYSSDVHVYELSAAADAAGTAGDGDGRTVYLDPQRCLRLESGRSGGHRCVTHLMGDRGCTVTEPAYIRRHADALDRGAHAAPSSSSSLTVTTVFDADECVIAGSGTGYLRLWRSNRPKMVWETVADPLAAATTGTGTGTGGAEVVAILPLLLPCAEFEYRTIHTGDPAGGRGPAQGAVAAAAAPKPAAKPKVFGIGAGNMKVAFGGPRIPTTAGTAPDKGVGGRGKATAPGRVMAPPAPAAQPANHVDAEGDEEPPIQALTRTSRMKTCVVALTAAGTVAVWDLTLLVVRAFGTTATPTCLYRLALAEHPLVVRLGVAAAAEQVAAAAAATAAVAAAAGMGAAPGLTREGGPREAVSLYSARAQQEMLANGAVSSAAAATRADKWTVVGATAVGVSSDRSHDGFERAPGGAPNADRRECWKGFPQPLAEAKDGMCLCVTLSTGHVVVVDVWARRLGLSMAALGNGAACACPPDPLNAAPGNGSSSSSSSSSSSKSSSSINTNANGGPTDPLRRKWCLCGRDFGAVTSSSAARNATAAKPPSTGAGPAPAVSSATAVANRAHFCAAVFPPQWPGDVCVVGVPGEGVVRLLDYAAAPVLARGPRGHGLWTLAGKGRWVPSNNGANASAVDPSAPLSNGMKKCQEVSLTLPGHVVRAEAGSTEVWVSQDLREYLAAPYVAATSTTRSDMVYFDWQISRAAAAVAAAAGDGSDSSPAAKRTRGEGEKGSGAGCLDAFALVGPGSGSYHLAEYVSEAVVRLSEPYRGPTVAAGQPRVYLRTNLRPRGSTVSTKTLEMQAEGPVGDMAPYPGAANASSGSSSSSSGGDAAAGGGRYDHCYGPRRELARILLPSAAEEQEEGGTVEGTRNDNAVTALAAHPRWHVVVAGQLDDTLVLIG